MTTIDRLLDAAKAATGATSDKELAGRLGVKPTAVSNYRRGVSLPDAVVCATLAGLTGEPLAKVLGIVGEARAISREEKAVWRKLAATAMVTLCAIGFALPSLGKAHQINVSPYSTGGESGSMHIMSKATWVTWARVWRYYWSLLKLLLDRLLHGDSSPTENRSLEACK